MERPNFNNLEKEIQQVEETLKRLDKNILALRIAKAKLEKSIPMDAEVILRDELINFAKQMETVLRANDHKGGWDKCTLQYLSMRLTQERKELAKAFGENNIENIKHECCDVANFCMMIFDIVSKSK